MVAKATRAPSLFDNLRSLWRALAEQPFDTYRPELHYMRGPGPKWRAKHMPAPTEVSVPLHLTRTA